MGEKPGKVQAQAVEFSTDCAMIEAKSEVIGCSIAVDFREKGFYSSYTPDYTAEIPMDTIRLFIDTLRAQSATLQGLIQHEPGPIRKQNAEDALASLISFTRGFDISFKQKAA